ncbi:metal-dependent hydrolase [Alicyclobacillus fastidiosus]|uniref:Metal-dependent hydrolase n=1 Tax=Alicyclobacillus fastidiosus TaxID=392011 RepID=A0ABV5ABI7_9BACL|nr:metal-dependent hydrolase [Alicyclobacillus fastidiosus]WEH10396.1 metal-dependent hydrolase [Alicyclobacillus fastidiosus]
MDNVTHAAFGVGVFATYTAATGSPHEGSLAVAACVAAVAGAEWPDLDILARIFGGPVKYLYQHRQISHSIPLWFAASLLIAVITDAFVPGHFWRYAALAFAGTLTHILLDGFTTYGTRALWPFTNRRYRGDALFVIEPLYVILFIVGFAVIQTGGPYRATVYWLDALAIAFTLWRILLRLILGRRVRQWSAQFGDGREMKWRVVPTLFPIPHGYKYVLQEGVRFRFGSFTWNGRMVEEATVETATGPAVDYVLSETSVGRAMAWFAPMLFTKVDDDGRWTVVRLADASVRYFNFLPFSATVDLTIIAGGGYTVVNEGLRAQPVHIQKLWHDSFCALGDRVRLYIPSPRGYRSKSRA